MRRALVTLVAVLGLALVPLGTGQSSYRDPPGDARTGPDVTRVVVSDTSAGLITIGVLASRVPAALVSDYTLFGAILDTDADPTTGNYDGAERQVIVALNPDGSVRLTGARIWGEPWFIPGIAISATSRPDRVGFSFSRRELGIEEAFRFSVYTLNVTADGEYVGGDTAPDTGLSPGWTYRLTGGAATVPRPVIGTPRTVPAQPVAGRRFTVTFPVTRSDTGAPLARASLACTTRIAGRLVPHAHAYSTGKARAMLVVPRAARGKQLRVAVRVVAQNQGATKVVTYRIR